MQPIPKPRAAEERARVGAASPNRNDEIGLDYPVWLVAALAFALGVASTLMVVAIVGRW